MTHAANTGSLNNARRSFRLSSWPALALLTLLAVLSSACATATRSAQSDLSDSTWSPKDRTLAAALIASQLVDLGQTQAAVKAGLSEANPIYGSHPTLGRMLATKLVTTSAVLWAANHFPGLRSRILTTNLALQVGIVGLNARYVGLKVSF